MGKSNRRIGRELALQLLYQYEVGVRDIETLLEADWLNEKIARKLGWLRNTKADYERDIHSRKGDIWQFAEQLTLGAIEHLSELDKLISTHLIRWVIDRIAIIDLSILRIALYEMLFRDDIHHVVTMNEAIEITKTYGSDKSWKFINGVLDAIREEYNKK